MSVSKGKALKGGKTTLSSAVTPISMVTSIGKCLGPCRRENQVLANGLCADCHFYNVPITEVMRAKILRDAAKEREFRRQGWYGGPKGKAKR